VRLFGREINPEFYTGGFDRIMKIIKSKGMDINDVLDKLVALLMPSDPYKIILFGSYAKGTPAEHSDIDLMVILDNDEVAKTRKERLEKKLYIRSLVLEVNRKIPLDILVYSKAELKKLKEYGNFFVDEAEQTGRIIYEKAG
jgi:predicted nucleotidyltransferase